jgi:hypothetical protein
MSAVASWISCIYVWRHSVVGWQLGVVGIGYMGRKCGSGGEFGGVGQAEVADTSARGTQRSSKQQPFQ